MMGRNNKLRARERCPLHSSWPGPYYCCGREGRLEKMQAAVANKMRKPPSAAVQVTEDGREICSKQEMRRRKHVLMSKSQACYYCGEKFTEYSQIDLAHLKSKGMGGSRRDDSMKNLVLAHRACNFQNGSKSEKSA